MEITQFVKENAVKSKRKRSYTVHELSPPSPLSPLFTFHPLVLLFRPRRAILPTLRKTALDTSTSSDIDNDRNTSSTCLSDSFLAVCSHYQIDEDLAMSMKYRGVPFCLALTDC